LDPVKKEDNVKENIQDDMEESYEEPIKKYDTLTNMEEMKRSFFGDNIELFGEQLKEHPYKLYKANYKYNSDKDGVPEFSAKNLLKGFVRNFDNYRKYFMICFRCWKVLDKNEYKYESFWIVNTHEPIKNIIGSIYDDFDFEEIPNSELQLFIKDITRMPELEEQIEINNFTFVSESYVH
jgi:hypothetical protein